MDWEMRTRPRHVDRYCASERPRKAVIDGMAKRMADDDCQGKQRTLSCTGCHMHSWNSANSYDTTSSSFIVDTTALLGLR